MDRVLTAIPHAIKRELAQKVFAEGMHVADAARAVMGADGYGLLMAVRKQDEAISMLFVESDKLDRLPDGKKPTPGLLSTLDLKSDYLRNQFLQGHIGMTAVRLARKLGDDIFNPELKPPDHKWTVEQFLSLHRDVSRLLPKEVAAKVQKVPFELEFEHMTDDQLEAMAYDATRHLDERRLRLEAASTHRKLLSGMVDEELEKAVDGE